MGKYRLIIKLTDNLLKSIAHLLNEKRITFESAYIISDMRNADIKFLIEGINNYPDRKLDLNKLKKLPKRNTEKSGDIMYKISRKAIPDALIY